MNEEFDKAIDKKFQASLKFLNLMYQSTTKILNSGDEFSEKDVTIIKELQSKIKAFNIEKTDHEFTREDKLFIIVGMEIMKEQLVYTASTIGMDL